MKNHLFILTVFTALLMSCGGDKAWETAREQNTIAAYEKYMNENPEGTFIDTAKVIIDSLKVEEMEAAWKNATKMHKLDVFKAFLKDYPENPHIEQAKDLMKMIKDSNYKRKELEAWKVAKKKHTVKDYKEYLENYYNGEHKIYAWENIYRLENEHFFTNYEVIMDFFKQLDQEGADVEDVFMSFTPDSLMYNSKYLNSPYTAKMFEDDQSAANSIKEMFYSGHRFLLGLYGDPESIWDVTYKPSEKGIELVYSPTELYHNYYKFVWKYNAKNELEITELEVWFEGDV